MSAIADYTWKYPQLTLPVREGMSKSEEYISIVRKGILPADPVFSLPESGVAEQIIVDTPVGETEVLYLSDREIFEYFVRVLGYRCEPVPIPASTGAILISGINNWRKIKAHQQEYLLAGGKDWAEEFRQFTSVPENFKETVILLSRGNYSALCAQDAGMEEEEWLEKSRSIRTYHELSHFVSRKLFLPNKEVLRDEVVADSVGIVAAFGYYDSLLAKKVLGIEGDTYREGGRLENYVDREQLSEAMNRAGKIIEELKQFYDGNTEAAPLELLVELETRRIGMDI